MQPRELLPAVAAAGRRARARHRYRPAARVPEAQPAVRRVPQGDAGGGGGLLHRQAVLPAGLRRQADGAARLLHWPASQGPPRWEHRRGWAAAEADSGRDAGRHAGRHLLGRGPRQRARPRFGPRLARLQRGPLPPRPLRSGGRGGGGAATRALVRRAAAQEPRRPRRGQAGPLQSGPAFGPLRAEAGRPRPAHRPHQRVRRHAGVDAPSDGRGDASPHQQPFTSPRHPSNWNKVKCTRRIECSYLRARSRIAAPRRQRQTERTTFRATLELK